MKKSSRDRSPSGMRPIQQIELSEKNKKARIVLLIVFVLIAFGAFGYAIVSFLRADDVTAGWQAIGAQSEETHCGDDFVFNYQIGVSSLSASDEYRQLVSLYSDAAVKAYRLFHTSESFFGVNNIYTINTHVNQVLEVDSVLYHAFEQVAKQESRYLYFGPLYQEYTNLFFAYNTAAISEDDDPYVNDQTAMYFATLASYAQDETAINLVLLGDNRVCLFVSEDYLAFAEEHGIEVFIDFFRIKNAFIIDYFADVLSQNGYTLGNFSSYDGYVRNLDNSQNRYKYNLFDRMEDTVSAVAAIEYSGAGSLVYLRNYPLNSADAYYYYVSERLTVTPTIALEDGLYKSAVNSLIAYSKTESCAELVLSLMPIYCSDTFDLQAIGLLSEQGTAFAWCGEDARCVYYTHETFAPDLLITTGEYAYQKILAFEANG